MKGWVGKLMMGSAILVAWGSPGQADEINLKNGDRLTGEIVTMGEDTLTLKTTYGGDIKIDRKEIQGLISQNPISVQIKDGSVLRGRITSPSPNYVTVTSDQFGTTTAIPLSEIQAVNPPPAITANGRINLGGVVTKGNTDTKAINGAALYSLRADRHRFGLEGKYNYAEQSGKVTVRNSLAGLKYDFFITQKVYANAFGLFEQDTLQDLNLRSTFGAGVGYQFFDTSRTQLSGEVGLGYVNEDWRIREDDRSPTSRWAINWLMKVIPDRLLFFHRHEGFYDLDAPNAVRIRADQGFRVPLYKQFSLNLEYDIRYNNNPAPGRKTIDEAYIFGLSYELPL